MKKKLTRDIRFQMRATQNEAQEIITKAQLYFKGDLSAFLRAAVVAYRPIKRQSVK